MHAHITPQSVPWTSMNLFNFQAAAESCCGTEDQSRMWSTPLSLLSSPISWNWRPASGTTSGFWFFLSFKMVGNEMSTGCIMVQDFLVKKKTPQVVQVMVSIGLAKHHELTQQWPHLQWIGVYIRWADYHSWNWDPPKKNTHLCPAFKPSWMGYSPDCFKCGPPWIRFAPRLSM